MNLFSMYHGPKTHQIKDGLISESFSLHLQQNLYPEHILFRWIVLRIVIWHIFWKWKNFLRLIHLYLLVFIDFLNLAMLPFYWKTYLSILSSTVQRLCFMAIVSTIFPDYGRPIKPFYIEIPNFWACADNLGR